MVSALHHNGERIQDLHGLADLCNVALVRKALTFFIDRYRRRHGNDADPAESTMVGGIAEAARAVAKHYVQAPAEVVKELSRIAAGSKSAAAA